MMIAQNTMWGISPNYRKTIRAFHPLWVKFSSDIGGEVKLGKSVSAGRCGENTRSSLKPETGAKHVKRS